MVDLSGKIPPTNWKELGGRETGKRDSQN